MVAAKKPAAKKAAAPAKSRLSAADLASEYGYVSALINSNSELKGLFAKAYGTGTTGQWTARKFQAALQNTAWYKTHSDQWRKTETLRLADPTTFTASVTAATQDAKRLAANMGANITDAQAAALGKTFYMGGYNQAQQQQALGEYINTTKSTPDTTGGAGGTYGQTLAALKQHGANMGVQQSDTYYEAAAKSVAMGLSTADDWTGDITTQAKSLYAPYAVRLDQGATVKDLASSYTNQMAQTLELDPNSVSLFDPTIQKALKGAPDPKSGMPTTQSLWDFDQGLKADPRWATTKNANQLANDTALNVLQSMGFQA